MMSATENEPASHSRPASAGSREEVFSPAQANGVGRVGVGVTHHQYRDTLLALSGRAPGRAARCEIQSSQQIRKSAWRSACPGVGRSPLGGQLRVAVSGLSGWPGVGFQRLDARFGVLPGLDGKGRGGCWSEWQGREQRLGRARRRRCAGYDEPASKRFRSKVGLGVAGLGVADLGGTSSSIATGTSGSAGFALAATTGCGASTGVAGPVVSAVAAGQNKLAVIERIAAIANNNANASHMTVCFIAASPRPIEQKIRRIPQVRGGAWQLQNQFGLVRGRLMALAGRPRGKRLSVETRRRVERKRNPSCS